MYLYSITNLDSDKEGELVREIVLLQHENNYTEDEFKELVSHFYTYSVSSLKEFLSEEKGFRIVPTIEC